MPVAEAGECRLPGRRVRREVQQRRQEQRAYLGPREVLDDVPDLTVVRYSREDEDERENDHGNAETAPDVLPLPRLPFGACVSGHRQTVVERPTRLFATSAATVTTAPASSRRPRAVPADDLDRERRDRDQVPEQAAFCAPRSLIAPFQARTATNAPGIAR